MANDSFAPMRRKRISRVPVCASKDQTPFLDTIGMGKGQFCAEVEDRSVRLASEAVHLAVLGEERPAIEIVLVLVAGREELAVSAADLRPPWLVPGLDREEQCLRGVFRGGVGSLVCLLGSARRSPGCNDHRQ